MYTPVLGGNQNLWRTLIRRVLRFGVLGDVATVRGLLGIWGILSTEERVKNYFRFQPQTCSIIVTNEWRSFLINVTIWQWMHSDIEPIIQMTSLLRFNAKGFFIVYLPPLLDFLNVFYSNGTASPRAERTRLFPGWALPWNYQRLAEERRSLSKILIFQAP